VNSKIPQNSIPYQNWVVDVAFGHSWLDDAFEGVLKSLSLLRSFDFF
jgi:hypothetical protein